MAYEALRHYSDRDLTLRFVSNVDGTDFAEATRDLDAAETLFIVCSKTFTTLETLTNAHAARDWSVGQLGDEKAVAQHFVAVSTNADGVDEVRHRAGEHVRLLGLGRRPLLDGFGDRPVDDDRHRPRALPRHARRLPRDGRALPQRAAGASLPALLGLLAIWNNDFLGAATLAVLPYEQYLKRLPAYLQQLTMESNGKHVRSTASPSTSRPRRSLGRARHQRPAFVLPADPPGHAPRAVRLHRLLPSAESARRAARPADGQPVRAERGARVRQDRGARWRPKARRPSSCRIASSKATGRATRCSPSG